MRYTTALLSLAAVAVAQLNADDICGNNAIDCGNGFCCREGGTCGEVPGTDIPGCGGIDPALPFNVGGDVISSLVSNAAGIASSLASDNGALVSSLLGDASSIIDSLPSNLPAGIISDLQTLTAIPTELATYIPSSLLTLAPSDILTYFPQASATGANAEESTGAAAALKMTGGYSSAWAVVGIWGAAAVGGMAFVLA